jgi:hypothetical protein
MARLTAIELAADSCTLVSVAVRGQSVGVRALDRLDPAAFPGAETFARALSQTRRRLKLPRRARVVVWGVPAGAPASDPAVAPLLQPLRSAGFRIDRVVAPTDALAAIARLRQPRSESAIAWIALNRADGAIVVVRPGRLLHAAAFTWDSTPGAAGSQAQLLRRYLQVAALTPEIRRAIAAARQLGFRVAALVTCGDLPDLRSLTMPLIEELDLEVETLDSLEGLDVQPGLRDRAVELAPAIRMACAGAVARPARPAGAIARVAAKRDWLRPAAAAALVAAVAGFLYFSVWRASAPSVPSGPAAAPQAASPAAGAPATARPVQPAQGAPTQPQVTPPQPQATPPTLAQPQPAAPRPTPPQPAAPQPEQTRGGPPATAPQPPVSKSAAGTSVPSRPTAPASKPVSGAAPAAGGRVAAPTSAVSPQSGSPPPALPPAAPRADKSEAASPALLPDPMPRITTILTSEDRRFALIDGRVVHVGDKVGPRVVTAIDARTVVLREPSGVRIRVGLGGRFIGIERKR